MNSHEFPFNPYLLVVKPIFPMAMTQWHAGHHRPGRASIWVPKLDENEVHIWENHRNIWKTSWWFGTFGWFFHFIYGMSSFPLTKSYFSRLFFNHQPDLLRSLWERAHGVAIKDAIPIFSFWGGVWLLGFDEMDGKTQSQSDGILNISPGYHST